MVGRVLVYLILHTSKRESITGQEKIRRAEKGTLLSHRNNLPLSYSQLGKVRMGNLKS